jgi:hypothetical protein
MEFSLDDSLSSFHTIDTHPVIPQEPNTILALLRQDITNSERILGGLSGGSRLLSGLNLTVCYETNTIELEILKLTRHIQESIQ